MPDFEKYLAKILDELQMMTDQECFEGIKKVLTDARDKEIVSIGEEMSKEEQKVKVGEIQNRYMQYFSLLNKMYFFWQKRR